MELEEKMRRKKSLPETKQAMIGFHLFPDDAFALEFLLDNNVNVNALTPQEKNTSLHLLADYPGLSQQAVKVIAKGANVNAQNSENL